MSDPIIVNQSTSVVQVDTSTVVYPRNAVVLLSTITSPGTIVTIRDVTGYASTNRGISVSTMAGVHFLDGPGCNVYNINQPYGFLTVTPRTSNVWAVLNTFAFPDQAATPSVVGIYAQHGNFSNIYGNTGTINNLTVNYSTFLNVSIVSSMLAKSISTRTLAVSDTLSAVNISTSSGFFSSVNINNSLLPSTSLDVNGSMRASTLFITKDAYIDGFLVYNTSNMISTVRGLGTATYVSSSSVTSTVRGLGTASYVSSASLVSTVQGLGSSKYVSSLDLISTVQGLGSSKYVSSLDLMSTVQGLGNSSYVSSASLTSSLQGLGVNLTSTVAGLGSSKYVSSLDLMSTVQGLGNSSYVSSASLTSSLQSVGSNITSTVAGLGSSKYVSSLDLMSTVQGLGNSSYVSTASLISTVQGLGSSRYISAPNILVSSISTFNFVVYGTSTFINSSNIYIGNSYSTNTLRFIGTSNDGYGDSNSYGTTVLAERIWSTNNTGLSNASELLLFKGTHDSNSVPGPDRVRVLTTGSFQVDIASNGGTWPINGNPPSTLIQALTINSSGKVGIGCNSPAYTLDVAGSINATAVTSGGSPYTTVVDVSSTIKGLGSSGYLSTPYINISSISTQSLVVFGQSTIIASCNIFIGDNTSTNIIRFIGTRDDRWVINPPIIPFVNTAISERLYYTNEYQAGSSELLLFKGKNSALINGAGIDRVRVLTTGGFKVDIASNGGVWPIGGNPPSTSIEALSIGSNGWMGLNCNVASYTLDVNGNINASSNLYVNGIVLINSDKLVSTVQGLGSSSYVSSSHLASTVQGLGSSSYVSSSQLASTVQGLGSSSYVSSFHLASTVQGLGSSSYVSSSHLVSTVRGLGSSSYVSSLDLVSTVQGLGSSSYVSSSHLVSTVRGLGSSSYVSSLDLVSTVQGLGSSSYVSSSHLVSTVRGLGSSSYVSSLDLVSTVQGLGSSSYVSSSHLVSTVRGLASSSYISSSQLVSTVQGLGTSGYLSSPDISVSSISTQLLVVYGSNLLLGNNPTTNTIRFIGSDRDAWNGTSLISPYVNTVISERLYDNLGVGSSELLLFKGNDAATVPGSGLDRVRVLSPGGFKVDIATNNESWPIGGNPPNTLVEALTVISNGSVGISCNAPSYTLDVHGNLNVRSNIFIDGNFLPTTNNTISTVIGLGSSSYVSTSQVVSTVQGLGSSSYVSTSQLISTVQGLASSSYVSTSQLVSTVQGLGTSSYISSLDLVSTVKGLGSSSYVSSLDLVSTVQGLGSSSYISSSQLVSTVQGLGSAGYLSTPFIRVSSISTQSLVVFGESTIIGSCNIFIGNNPSTNILRFYGTTYDGVDNNNPLLNSLYQNTAIAERLYYGGPTQLGTSELLLFKGTNSDNTNAQGPDRIRVLATGGFKVDITSNGGAWPINGNPPSTVIEALSIGCNGWMGINCNAPSYNLDVEGRINASVDILVRGNALINATHITSTVVGLGSSSYVSTSQLVSTVRGLGSSSYISSLDLFSTVQGLGSSSYVSTSQLVSTVRGLGSSSYISSLDLVSTVQGLGSSSYVSTSQLVSTVRGLGSSSYVSTSQLVSTVQGLGSSLYISSTQLTSTVQGLGTSGYLSTPNIIVSSISTQSLVVYGSNILFGNNPSTNMIRFHGTIYDGFDSITAINPLYENTVIAERLYYGGPSQRGSSELLLFKGNDADNIDGPDRVRVLASGGFKVDIASNGGAWPVNGNPPSTFVEALTVISNGWLGLNCNVPAYTLDVNGSINVLSNIYVNRVPIVNKDDIVSSVRGLGSSGYISSVNGVVDIGTGGFVGGYAVVNSDKLRSTVVGLGSSSYVSSLHLASTVQGLGSSSYVSSTQLASTVQGLGYSSYVSSSQLASTVQGLGSSAYVSSLHLVSTVQGLGSSSYVSSIHLASTVQGLGSSGYLSSVGGVLTIANNVIVNGLSLVNSDNLRSTVIGIGSSSYVSSLHLASTVQGLGSSSYVSSLHLASTVQGLGSSGYVSSFHLGSTLQGLGSSGYVSSFHLGSTLQGLGSSGYVSSSLMASTVRGLGSSGYVSSVNGVIRVDNNIFVNGFPVMTQQYGNPLNTIYNSNLLIGASASTNTLRFFGTAYDGLTPVFPGTDDTTTVVNSYAATVIAERLYSSGPSQLGTAELVLFKGQDGTSANLDGPDRVRILSAGGFKVDISEEGKLWIPGSDIPNTTIEALTINCNGRIGIQCNSPLYTLDINGSINVSGGINSGGSAGVNSLELVSTVKGLGSVNYVSSVNGRVSLTALYLTSELIVKGATTGVARITSDASATYFQSANNAESAAIPIRFTGYYGSPLLATIAANGNFSAAGSITGATGITATAGGITATAGGITATTGDIIATVGNVKGVDVIATSDFRLKKNIVTIDYPLEKISAMRGVYFNKISDSTIRKVGVIAQEIETVLPEVVFTDDTEEKMKGVSYGNITSILIEGMKAQQSSIQSLVTTISSLQAQIVLLQRPTP